MDAARVLTLLRPHLEATGTRWMLAGGLALVAWGSTRTTADTDLLMDDGSRPTLLSRLREAGFEILQDTDGFTNLMHFDREIGRLDLIWVEGETSRRMFAAAVERPGPDAAPLLVPAPEHLVAMKVKAMKEQPTRVFRDADDLRLLLSLPDLDENAVRATFERAGLGELHDRIKGAS
ncbi:MAG: nucleotidyl transferase AbiEii/AbiGii toxin family protein [Thermoanaerobaculia bacterium]|jgi:hypothetical protein|nr:nucleotidyl transferase AbiEii/AbiGii toxin family protein [Thermoanaerobaculia bacterium]